MLQALVQHENRHGGDGVWVWERLPGFGYRLIDPYTDDPNEAYELPLVAVGGQSLVDLSEIADWWQ
jgi:hypothetical protein